jgi:hypothetical protein
MPATSGKARSTQEESMLNMPFRALTQALFATGLVLAMLPAQAALIVDTGEPYAAGFGSALSGDNGGLQFHQYLAGQFSTTQAYTLQEVSTHLQFNSSFTTAGSFNFKLYADATGLPGTMLFETANLSVPMGAAGAWYSASGLSWTVGPGSYWLAIEADKSPISIVASSAGHPMQANAFDAGWDKPGVWEVLHSGGPSIRIDAVTAVPEPASTLLLLGGIAALGLRTRRRQG